MPICQNSQFIASVRATWSFGRKASNLFGEIQEDRTAFEHTGRLRRGAIDENRDFRVRIDANEAGAKLLAVADPDQPRIVFGALMASRQKLFKHDSDLDAVGRRQGVKLQRMLSDGQFLLMRRSCDRAIDIGKLAAISLFHVHTLGGS